MKLFLNWKNSQGRETIDELNSEDFATTQEFRQEKRRLLLNYELAYHVYGSGQLYWSSRCCANWKNNS